MTKLALFGAGGFGREVLWQLEHAQTGPYDVLGFIDDNPDLLHKSINGVPVLGGVQWFSGYSGDIGVAICVGNPHIRREIYNKLESNPRIHFPTIIAGDVQRSKFVDFGQGCIVCLSSVLTVNVRLGDFVVVSINCTIGHDAVLDDFATLFPSVTVSGNVHVGECTQIGTNTSIIQGVKIGANSIIGAGAAVIRNIPEGCTAVGVPARM